MSHQRECLPLSRPLYEAARRYVRPAIRSKRRYTDVCNCLEMFPEQSAWRQAVSMVCVAYNIQVKPTPSAKEH